MTLTGHATVLLVRDVRRSADYYRDKLGFEVECWDVNPEHYAYARRDSCSIHLACFAAARPQPNSEAVPPDMFDVYVYADDVDGLHRELVERGADIHGPPAAREYGMYDFRVSDADGYVLGFGRGSG